MRKKLLIKILAVVLFTSCSNDNGDKDNTVDPKSILIKKITETIYFSNDSETRILNFSYENNVLKSVTSDKNRSEFLYNGDKISKVDYFKNEIANGSTTFNYDGDLLKYTLSGANQDERTEYAYTNGILASQKSGYLTDGNFIVQKQSIYSFDQNKNATEITDKSSLFGPETISKSKYFYENKNNPMKFMNKYFRLVFETEGFDGISNNNVTSREYYYPVTTETPVYYNFEITYNADDFPIEIKKIAKENNFVISKTVIEYQ
ncbi:hypothetical protein L1276_003353 [Flavobacterium sp. HSC-32F16]|uniref:hypothetical protein n=1 Tax=Flavobacterium sp. HSC-32F16 TaxID=2910964 RepID=UPI0020A55733|nr:hypothetical protein [Flavobacterium sp. HSC-32F16]MCP2028185.1 hypothetical protein [Flavobacterium sp. HSC-32F16]